VDGAEAHQFHLAAMEVQPAQVMVLVEEVEAL